jgi:hypothetical protein
MQLPVIIENLVIRQDEQGRYCLNDLHKASGGEKRHQPANWLRMDQTIELIEEMSIPQIRGIEQIQPVSSKQQIGTFVVKELLYSYAMWISPKFHLKVIRVFDAVITQAAKVAAATTWEQQRQTGKEVRANFTGTLRTHGVSGFGFAQCTDGIYRPLFGTTASKLKKERGLTKQASLRDAMSGEELIASAFAEIVASQRMDANEDHGNSPCYKTCKASGAAVKGLLVKKLN